MLKFLKTTASISSSKPQRATIQKLSDQEKSLKLKLLKLTDMIVSLGKKTKGPKGGKGGDEGEE